MDTNNWTKDDFRAFVMFFTACIDGELNEDEKQLIEQIEAGDRIREIQKAAKKLSDLECLELIESRREQFYPGQQGRDELLQEITELFKADGNYSQFEHVVLRNLKRVL